MNKLPLKTFVMYFAAMIFLPVLPITATAQEFDSLGSYDGSQVTDTSSVPVSNDQEDPYSTSTPSIDMGPEPTASPGQESGYDGESVAQNAIIEGVQISTEPGDKSDEKVVSCYFIFRDKPSSYFYEVKHKEKKILFEFNDTKRSAAPIPINAEPPIESFVVEERKVDVNKEVRGLKPEYHTQVRVTFSVSAIPEISVHDEYNVISFSYKWSSDPGSAEKYTVKDHSPRIMLWSTAAVAGIGGGVLGYYLLRKKPPTVEGDITTDDLPKHIPP